MPAPSWMRPRRSWTRVSASWTRLPPPLPPTRRRSRTARRSTPRAPTRFPSARPTPRRSLPRPSSRSLPTRRTSPRPTRRSRRCRTLWPRPRPPCRCRTFPPTSAPSLEATRADLEQKIADIGNAATALEEAKTQLAKERASADAQIAAAQAQLDAGQDERRGGQKAAGGGQGRVRKGQSRSGGGSGRVRAGRGRLRRRRGRGQRGAGQSGAGTRRRPEGDRRHRAAGLARHGPHEELRRGELRLRCRSHRRHRVVLPLHLLPRGGARGPYHHDPHGGGGAHAHRHLQGARLLAGAHHVEVPHLRRPGRRRSAAFIGIAVLSQVLPWVIMEAYSIVYYVPRAAMPIDWPVALAAAGLGIGITLLATWAAAAATLRETPAALMQPPAPKAGKRILLERVGPSVAPPLVLVEGDVPQHLPLQAPSRHDVSSASPAARRFC